MHVYNALLRDYGYGHPHISSSFRAKCGNVQMKPKMSRAKNILWLHKEKKGLLKMPGDCIDYIFCIT